jgi:hypothetical protein
MPATDRKLFQVRLTEAEKRGIKAMAASQGLTLRQAVLQAFQAWAAQLYSGSAGPARGTPTGTYQNPGPPSRGSARSDESRRGNPGGGEKAKPARNSGRGAHAASGSMGRQSPYPAAPLPAWLREAGKLDWSKCPVAECLQGETGIVWVVRGTDAPLAKVFQSVADGHPVVEIAEYFEITPLQLLTVLRFAAEGAAPAAPGR